MASMMVRAALDEAEWTIARAAAAQAGQTTPEWIADAIRAHFGPYCSQLVREVDAKHERGKS